MKPVEPTEKTDPAIVELLMIGGYLPDLDLSLRLGREIQNRWMNSYQDVLITNTFKKILRSELGLPV
ncbi:MAG: hypothetical protein ABSF09_08250 [Candidatus Bathyarchaeia archaeon]